MNARLPFASLLRPWRLHTRVLAVLLVLFVMGLAVFDVSTVRLVDKAEMAHVDQQLNMTAHELESAHFNGRQVPSEYRLMFFSSDGTPSGRLGGSDGASTRPALPPMNVAAVSAHGDVDFTVPDAHTGMRWRVRTLIQPPTLLQPTGGTAAVAVSLADFDALGAELNTIELTSGVLIAVLFTLAAAWLVVLCLLPLTRSERTAQAIAVGDIERRFAGENPYTEIGTVVTAFNEVLTQHSSALRQVAQSESRLRAFVADASRELRTPLSAIRSYAELYRRGGDPARMMERIEDEATRMAVLVDDLLLLAQLDREGPVDLSEVDLSALTAEVTQDTAMRWPDHPVYIHVSDTPVRVNGDPDRLRQVVANLVDNALIHTPAGTTVDISVGFASSRAGTLVMVAEAGAENSEIPMVSVLEVRDYGPGIPQDEAERVFDRFYRSDQSRACSSGSGLGLAIAGAILAAHGARIQLMTAPGHGAAFRVLFPANGSI